MTDVQPAEIQAQERSHHGSDLIYICGQCGWTCFAAWALVIAALIVRGALAWA